jgi:putative tryptophan/tyrosine transport system substrate-binding protein
MTKHNVGCWPQLGPRAMSARCPLPVIGSLHPGSPEANVSLVASFRKGLGETGYAEGRNVTIEFRWAHGDNGRLAELAADLVLRQVVVIVTPIGTATAVCAEKSDSAILVMKAAENRL